MPGMFEWKSKQCKCNRLRYTVEYISQRVSRIGDLDYSRLYKAACQTVSHIKAL